LAFKAKLRLQSGTQCSGPEGGTAQQVRSCLCYRFAPEPLMACSIRCSTLHGSRRRPSSARV
jgi:hypothetical protein